MIISPRVIPSRARLLSLYLHYYADAWLHPYVPVLKPSIWPAVVTLQYAVVIDSSRRPPENKKETRPAIGEAKQKLTYYRIDILLGLDENV